MRAFQSAGTYSTRRCALPFTRYELDVPGIYQGRIRLTNSNQSMLCRSQVDLDVGEVHEEDRRRIPNGDCHIKPSYGSTRRCNQAKAIRQLGDAVSATHSRWPLIYLMTLLLAIFVIASGCVLIYCTNLRRTDGPGIFVSRPRQCFLFSIFIGWVAQMQYCFNAMAFFKAGRPIQSRESLYVVAFIAVVGIMTRITHPRLWTPITKVSTIRHTGTVLIVENNELVLQTISSMEK